MGFGGLSPCFPAFPIFAIRNNLPLSLCRDLHVVNSLPRVRQMSVAGENGLC